ncbi:helix-turn-helix domain-containing protein [Salmonella enterica]
MNHGADPSRSKETDYPYTTVLVEALKPASEIRNIVPRSNLSLSINNVLYCYLLLKGNFGVFRKSDNRLLTIAYSPAIVGIAGLLTGKTDVYLKAFTSATIGKISLDAVELSIETQDLWKYLALHMIQLSDKIFISGMQLSATTAFEMVCLQLKELMNENNRIRESITAERYIRDKTNLSRSRIMKILSGLRSGGYIEIQRGILVAMSELPSQEDNDPA